MFKQNFSSRVEKYFTCSLRSLVKYFSTLEDKFRISRPCNILYVILRLRYFKWIRTFKKWFNRFFLYPGMKLEFLFSKITIICTLFGHREIIDLFFCCFALKCERTSVFLTPFAYTVTVFRCSLTVTRKFCPHVINTIAMSFRKNKEKYH